MDHLACVTIPLHPPYPDQRTKAHCLEVTTRQALLARIAHIGAEGAEMPDELTNAVFYVSEADALARDADDPLAGFRERFYLLPPVSTHS